MGYYLSNTKPQFYFHSWTPNICISDEYIQKLKEFLKEKKKPIVVVVMDFNGSETVIDSSLMLQNPIQIEEFDPFRVYKF